MGDSWWFPSRAVGTRVTMTSTDGINWTGGYPLTDASDLEPVTYRGWAFVAVSGTGTGDRR